MRTQSLLVTCSFLLLTAFASAAAIGIDDGRQLFVDNYLIESLHGVSRHWNSPVKEPNPVLTGNVFATDGGLWWDPSRRCFRLWYVDRWLGDLLYAESPDGVRWTKPNLDIKKGTNRLFDPYETLDTWTVVPDYTAANPYAAWKMLISLPGGASEDRMYSSKDGIHFERLGFAGWSGDRTTMYYDPFRAEWVFSLRDYWCGRARRRWTTKEFVPPKLHYGWERPDGCKSDAEKPPMDEKAAEKWRELAPGFGPRGYLYSFNAVPYESLMLGVFMVYRSAPPNARGHDDNQACNDEGLPKYTELRYGFSRDGRNFGPACDDVVIRPSGWGSGKWDTGYLSAVGGLCTIHGDELRFYYTGLRGDARKTAERAPLHEAGMYSNGSVGYARLRRDGFAGLVAGGDGEVVTKPVVFSGRHLFVNAECNFGSVRAELIDPETDKPYPGFARNDCVPLAAADSTKAELAFKGGDLSSLAGKPVRVRFVLVCSTLYSFWVSPTANGESGGYLAAGGPGYAGLRDLYSPNAVSPVQGVVTAATDKVSAPAGELTADGIRDEVERVTARNAELQRRLSRRVSLADYRALVVSRNGTNVWTKALRKALADGEIVVIPAAEEKYFIDETVVIPSNRRIEATGATVRLFSGMRTILFRNEHPYDGTLEPVPAGRRDDNIAIVGGRWEDNCECRRGYGWTGRYDPEVYDIGKWKGVSTLFYFGNVDHVTVADATFYHCGAFAVQAGDAASLRFERIRFDRCFADGLHLNGNLSHVLCRDVRGQVGDDLVALNAYDWLKSSVNFGPQRFVCCEDLELEQLRDFPFYPAIRLQPAKYRYGDGSIVDCAISDVLFRRVKGIMTYKMYLQTPWYKIGGPREWAEVGSGGNLHFEDLDIYLDSPIDWRFYCDQDPVRGHYAMFEFGANLTSVYFKNVNARFNISRWKLQHLALVGPKSSTGYGKDREVFDPYVNCEVGKVVLENVRVNGPAPDELVRATVFDDINKDGQSSGRGVIRELIWR